MYLQSTHLQYSGIIFSQRADSTKCWKVSVRKLKIRPIKHQNLPKFLPERFWTTFESSSLCSLAGKWFLMTKQIKSTNSHPKKAAKILPQCRTIQQSKIFPAGSAIHLLRVLRGCGDSGRQHKGCPYLHPHITSELIQFHASRPHTTTLANP